MDANENLSIPFEFQGLVGDNIATLCWENLAKTYYLQGRNGINSYLKIQQVGAMESLESQSNRLRWLRNKLPVPEVIEYGIIGKYEFLITSELPGVDASNKAFKKNTKEMIELIARGLRKIHEIPIVDCPYDNSIDWLLNIIRHNYEKGMIISSDLFKKFGETSIEKLINEIEIYANQAEEDSVFTHGDYSLPNIILHDGRISGFIDLGNCGIADRYYDLAVVEKSIIRNFGNEYVDFFYDQYGIVHVDRQKIRFFQIVELFVWG